MFLYGAVLVAVMLLAPTGLAGLASGRGTWKRPTAVVSARPSTAEAPGTR